MKRWAPFLIIALVAAITLASAASLYRAKQVRAATQAAATVAQIPATIAPSASAHVRGPADAPVTIEEFGDFQCPPCAALSHNLHKLEEDYRGQLQIVFRHYPLKNHQNARPAALAAEAAGLQGRFWEMHDLLYKNQVAWSTVPDVLPLFNSYATTLGLDPTRFAADMQNKNLSARIVADQARAASLGVTQTPTVFVNGRLVPPSSLNSTAFRALVDSALKGEPIP